MGEDKKNQINFKASANSKDMLDEEVQELRLLEQALVEWGSLEDNEKFESL